MAKEVTLKQYEPLGEVEGKHGSESKVLFEEPHILVPDNIFKESIKSPKKIQNKITKSRTILWYWTFIGFAINYMFRISLNIAIIDMVQRTRSTNFNNVTLTEAECYNSTTNIESQIYSNNSAYVLPEYKTRYSLERVILKFFKIDFKENGFDWNEYQQGLLLGSFYWGGWLTTIPGGLLARIYGAKLVFGLSNLIGSLMCFFIPIVSFIDIRLVIILRVIQGLIAALSWPSIHEITARWIPPNERSTFMTVFMGTSVGIALFYPFFGYIIDLTSWEWAFHACAVFGTLWYFAWEYFVFDSPAKHPRIHKDEREYIESTLGTTIQRDNKAPTPWISILTSGPVWMIFIAGFGANWATQIYMTQIPTYFKIILGWNIGVVGIIAGLPHLTKMIFSYIYSSFSDYMLRNNKLTRTNVRKLAVAVTNIMGGISILILAFSGCNTALAVFCIALAGTLGGALVSGSVACTVDISPNFASVIAGINGVVIMIPGSVSAAIVGNLTVDNQTLQQWQYVFLIAVVIQFITGALFLIFGSSELQIWNGTKLDKNERISVPLMRENEKDNTDDRNIS